MTTTDDELIWWVGSAACRQIGEPHYQADFADEPDTLARLRQMPGIYWLNLSPWPDYIKQQYQSRYGRAGRGRLWVATGLLLCRLRWDDLHPVAQRIIDEDAGGIVIRARDLPVLRGMPGFVTDAGFMEILF